MSRIILAIVIVLEIVWVLAIGYPPSIQQIDLGVSSVASLWLVRFISLFFIVGATYLIASLLENKFRYFYWIFILISPAVNVLWLAYPIDCFKIFAVSLLIFLVLKKNLHFIIGISLSIVVLLCLNKFYLKQDLAIFSTLSLDRSQSEIMQRIAREDTTDPHINLPLWFRRIGYNKYFVTIQNTAKEAIKFWDQESLFFQEVHPLDQKSVVILFWPEAILLLVILWLYAAKLDPKLKKSLLIVMLFSWVYFVLTNDTPYKQLIMALFWVSILLAWGTVSMFELKNYRWLISLLIFFVGYGAVANFSDRLKRPLFWLDNRPVVFQLLLESAKNFNYQNYSTVYMTNLIGPADKYCHYYLNNCQNFQFSNFDLSQTPVSENSLYLGFIGNFLGPKNDNKLLYSDYLNWVFYNKADNLAHFSVRDTVAFKYGNDLIVASKK